MLWKSLLFRGICIRSLVYSGAVFLALVFLTLTLPASNTYGSGSESFLPHPSLDVRRSFGAPRDGFIPMPLAADCGRTGDVFYVEDHAPIGADDIAYLQIDRNTSEAVPFLHIVMTQAGEKKLDALTRNWLDQPMAVTAQGEVYLFAYIKQPFSKDMLVSNPSQESFKRALEKLTLPATNE